MKDEKKSKQCKPVSMQDTGPKASQENPDDSNKFHVEQSGPGMTSTKVPDDAQPGTPGMTSKKSEG